MLSSGLFIGWGFVNRFVFFNHWTMAYSTLALHVLVMSWFAFAIAGFIICALIYEKVTTKIIYVSDYGLDFLEEHCKNLSFLGLF